LELKLRGAEKLACDESCNVSDIRVVLESDGTEVEDDGYFQTAEKDTIFILLQPGESWLPLGVEALKTALSAIPGLVSEALNKLEDSDKLPNWKVADNNGIITVLLSWDTRERTGSPLPEPDIDDLEQDIRYTPDQPHRSAVLASSDPQSKGKSDDLPPVTSSPSNLIKRTAQSPPILRTPGSYPVISSNGPPHVPRVPFHLEGLTAHIPHLNLPEIQHSFYTGSGDMGSLDYEEDTDSDEDKTDQGSPNREHSHCDFHCSAIHRQIQIKKSVATSPIQETPPLLFNIHTRDVNSMPQAVRRPGGKFVRFQDLELKSKSLESQDSDTETTEREDEQLFERYLLLVDQLSIGHEKHLSIKVSLQKVLSPRVCYIDLLCCKTGHRMHTGETEFKDCGRRQTGKGTRDFRLSQLGDTCSDPR
jgi:hypothetical protein